MFACRGASRRVSRRVLSCMHPRLSRAESPSPPRARPSRTSRLHRHLRPLPPLPSRHHPPFHLHLGSPHHSMTRPKLPTVVSWIATRPMPRSYNSWDGYTISRATVSPAKKPPSITWRNRSSRVSDMLHPRRRCGLAHTLQITTMRRAGTSWAAATSPSANTPRPTKPTNKPCTATHAIPLFGAPSASSITRSTSTAMRSTPTRAPFVSMPTSPRSGMTSGPW